MLIMDGEGERARERECKRVKQKESTIKSERKGIREIKRECVRDKETFYIFYIYMFLFFSASLVSEFKRKEPPPRPPNSPSLRRNYSLQQTSSSLSSPGTPPLVPSPGRTPPQGSPRTPPTATSHSTPRQLNNIKSTPSLSQAAETGTDTQSSYLLLFPSI